MSLREYDEGGLLDELRLAREAEAVVEANRARWAREAAAFRAQDARDAAREAGEESA